MLNLFFKGLESILVLVVVLMRVKGGKLILMVWVVGFEFMIIFSLKFFIVGYKTFLIVGLSWWILLIKRMFLVCKFVKMVVKLLFFFIMGVVVILILVFIFLVMIWLIEVLFKLGGLKKSMWFKFFWCFLVV